MKRRNVLLSGFAAASMPRLLWSASGGPSTGSAAAKTLAGDHNAYFSQLNAVLKKSGPGHPVMMIDLNRLDRNIDQVVSSVGAQKTYRAVVKSLPSMGLLEHVRRRADTRALMVFHQPFLNLIAADMPDTDVLMGKPMPVNAARKFYQRLSVTARFNATQQLQWLIDSQDRLLQYQQLARDLGIKLRLNLEIDVGLRRGGFENSASVAQAIQTIQGDVKHLSFSGFMGYEAHLTGQKADLSHPGVKAVLDRYEAAIAQARQAGFSPESLTLNGAGSHTLRIYEKDRTMNDLSAGSGLVMPTDFDTHHLLDHEPAVFIAAPILKRYPDTRAIPGVNDATRRLFYIYGGFWKAQLTSPQAVGELLYESTNQSPIMLPPQTPLDVDDYMFFRPTQSEFVMLQFGDLLTVRDGVLDGSWPVFHQTG